MSATRRLKTSIAIGLMAMAFETQGCLPENYFADLAATSIQQIVDASLTAALDCLTPTDSTVDASTDPTADTSGS